MPDPTIDFSNLGGAKVQDAPANPPSTAASPQSAGTKFDSGKPIAVLHPSGEVHQIAVPEGTDSADLHSALANGGYLHYDFLSPQPTAQGALENSDKFRKAAQDAWGRAGGGTKRSGGKRAFSWGELVERLTILMRRMAQTAASRFKRSRGTRWALSTYMTAVSADIRAPAM
jgi:hypothetical protein